MECRIHIPQSLPINKSLTIFSVNSGYTLLCCLHVAYSGRQCGLRAPARMGSPTTARAARQGPRRARGPAATGAWGSACRLWHPAPNPTATRAFPAPPQNLNPHNPPFPFGTLTPSGGGPAPSSFAPWSNAAMAAAAALTGHPWQAAGRVPAPVLCHAASPAAAWPPRAQGSAERCPAGRAAPAVPCSPKRGCASDHLQSSCFRHQLSTAARRDPSALPGTSPATGSVGSCGASPWQEPCKAPLAGYKAAHTARPLSLAVRISIS